MNWRYKLFDIIEPRTTTSLPATVYDFLMIAVIIASLVPLAFKETNLVFFIIEWVATIIYIIDYILRFITADIKLKRGRVSFIRYPFTIMALIDLVTILPSFLELYPGFRVLRVFRLIQALRVLRVFRMMQYSRGFTLFINVIREQRVPLIAVATLVVVYILIAALVIFNVEPDIFDSFFDAIYWSTISITTIGYGDICPVTAAGRTVTMISSLVGIAVIALPASIITAGYVEEINKRRRYRVEKLDDEHAGAHGDESTPSNDEGEEIVVIDEETCDDE